MNDILLRNAGRLLLLCCCLCASVMLPAQVTLTADNFPFGDPAENDTFFVDTMHTYPLPQAGENQVWDYTDLTRDLIFELVYDEVEATDAFPDADYQFNIRGQLGGFATTGLGYGIENDTGRYTIGNLVPEQVIPLTTITGGPMDELRFPADTSYFNSPRIPLPFTFGDGFEINVEDSATDFLLTVAAFGLNMVPGAAIRNRRTETEIIGYGTLTMPTESGAPSDPFEVLLLRETESDTAFYTLGGAPAPPNLLVAFGLEQGSVTNDTTYAFFRPGFDRAVVSFQTAGNLQFRPDGATLNTSVRTFSGPEVSLAPNPVLAGGTVTVRAAAPLGEGNWQVFDTQGRVLVGGALPGGAADRLRMELPHSITPGLYYYRMTAKNGALMSTGKILVK